ncbi:MAG: class I SAM-dependent methyltransferase [Myxococcota bacterium]
MTELYDTIGRGYRRFRRPDPRIAGRIREALGGAESVANVGAGAGSYEPQGRRVVAVEPSLTMIRQRALDAAPAVRALASALPFRDASFDAALAVLTVHHWPDRARGLAELARAARRRVVILTHDPSLTGFWLSDYFPEQFEIDRDILPTLEELRRVLGRISVFDVPVPRDCTDGFRGAYWCRPGAYLDAGVRSAISSFAKVAPDELAQGLARLSGDLRSGEWERRHERLRSLASLDLGYRLVVAEVA